MKLNETDRRIVSLLQNDTRQTSAAIARIVGLSQSTIRRRTKLLVEDGALIIRAVPYPSKFGFIVSAMLGINVEPTKLNQVIRALSECREADFVAISISRHHLICIVSVRNLDELHLFVQSVITIIPGCERSSVRFSSR